MNINELFEQIQNQFLPDELNGEFQLHGNCIIWTYNLDNDSEEIDYKDGDDEESQIFDIKSPEELLQEAYDEDFDSLKLFLDEVEESDEWTFSDPETIENIISFKIF
jgi:hypothetical protein